MYLQSRLLQNLPGNEKTPGYTFYVHLCPHTYNQYLKM